MPRDTLGVGEAVARYARGWFPMDDPGAGDPELPWWTVEERWVLELDDASLARTRRAVRRSLAKAGPGWHLRADGAFEEVLGWCAAPRGPGDGTWITPRLQALYRRLHAAGVCRSFELWDDGRPIAGVLGVRLRRAAMLESMAHRVPHAGNVLVVRLLEHLRDDGVELVDVQTPTAHTERLGARPVPRHVYEARLSRALRPRG